MTALNGLLDGETAAALQGLYGVQNAEDSPRGSESEAESNWGDYEDVTEEGSYCDSCGGAFPEDELSGGTGIGDEEVLCGECDRRINNHAVGRFQSIDHKFDAED